MKIIKPTKSKTILKKDNIKKSIINSYYKSDNSDNLKKYMLILAKR